MRKITKLTSIVLILVSLISLCSGCVKSDTMVTIGIGVPWAEDSETYQSVMVAVEESNMFTESNYVKIELVPYVADQAGKQDILRQMKNGTIAMLFYERDEYVDEYLDLDSGMIATLTEIQQVYPACYENAKSFVMDTATDADGMNHMLPLLGNYQGVFFNEEIFLKYGLTVPKTWEQFTAAINTLKENGVTPIAGGFSDGGMKYWMDELILMEGGVAEHSYVPKYGVVNSWARAITDFETLYKSGTFNTNCMTATHADAVAMFNKGESAMILANSKDVMIEGSDTEKTGVFSLPVTTTGKKNIGDIICNYDTGIYVNSQFLTKKTEVIDCMIEFVIEYISLICDEDFTTGELEYPEYSYTAYKQDWSLPADPYTIGIEEIIEDNEFVSPEDIVEKDPKEPEEILAEDTLQERVFNMMENVTEAGRSLTTEFMTFDYFIDLVKSYIEKGGDVEKLLTDATAKEVEAQNGTVVAE